MGYSLDIPDEVPEALSCDGLAPSYKQIAIAILSSDHYMRSLGYSSPVSPWYYELKRPELKRRAIGFQLDMFKDQ